MEIIPAIDLMGRKVVRLARGDPKTRKVYDHLGDPVSIAQRWEREGADLLHVVDLDAALDLGNNRELIREIVDSVKIPVQVAGGIRSLHAAEKFLDSDVKRIVLGSLAFENPSLIKGLIDKFGSTRVVVALDHLGGRVVVKGWKSSTKLSVDDAMSKFLSLGVKLFLVTSVARDGMLSGPDIETLNMLCSFRDANVIASGGVRNLKDLINLKKIGVSGVIIGKALYEGRIRLRDVLEVIKGCERI